MKENFKNEYLNNKLEPESSEGDRFLGEKYRNRQNYLKTLNRGLFEHEYNEKDGLIEFIKGDTKVSLKYNKPDPEEWDRIMLGSGFEHNDWQRPSFKDIKKLERLVIENKDGCFDSDDLFGKDDSRIYFQSITKDLGNDKSHSFSFEDSVIVVDNDILTPMGLMTLFHEIGHYKIYKEHGSKSHKNWIKSKDRLLKKDSLFSKAKEQDAEKYIREERDASACALNDLKPFLKDLEIKPKEVEWSTHSYSLQGYSDFILTRFKNKK